MTIHTDVVVVGAGSAGCAVARRLADKGLRVALLEAGKSDSTLKSKIPALVGGVVNDPEFDWCYSADPDPSVGGRQDIWPAGRRLGGGSAINGMMFIRAHRYDFDHWASLGAVGWDYASVLPYFKRMEDNERGADQWRGTGGPISVAECRSRYAITDAWVNAVQQAGYHRSNDLNGELAEGVDYVQLSQRSGLRCSSAKGYLADAPSNLETFLQHEVDRIVVEAGRAVGVVARSGSQVRHFRAAKGVVLSAGSLNTPRLLMLSGIGPASHLQEFGIDIVQDLPGVGANLQEHVGTHLVNDVNAHTLNNDARGLAGFAQLALLAFARKGALTTGIGHAQAFVRTKAELPVPDVQLIFSAFAFDVSATGNLSLRKGASVTTLVGLTRPASRGRVRLRGSDPHLPPRIEHVLLSDEGDLDHLLDGIRIARRIMRQEAIAGFTTREVRPGMETANDTALLRDEVRKACLPLYHPVGTARMGAKSDPQSVICPDLSVHGLQGLWVADASIMPAIPAGNTNATCLMIGDKAADHIAPN